MEAVLEENEVPVDVLKAAIRKGVISGELNPVFVGSAYKNKGIQELLDAVVDYLPSPLDVPEVDGTDLKGVEVVRHADPKEPFSALAFKIMAAARARTTLLVVRPSPPGASRRRARRPATRRRPATG